MTNKKKCGFIIARMIYGELHGFLAGMVEARRNETKIYQTFVLVENISFDFLISFMLRIQPQHGSYPLLFLRRFKHTSVLAGASRIAEQDRRRFLCL